MQPRSGTRSGLLARTLGKCRMNMHNRALKSFACLLAHRTPKSTAISCCTCGLAVQMDRRRCRDESHGLLHERQSIADVEKRRRGYSPSEILMLQLCTQIRQNWLKARGLLCDAKTVLFKTPASVRSDLGCQEGTSVPRVSTPSHTHDGAQKKFALPRLTPAGARRPNCT